MTKFVLFIGTLFALSGCAGTKTSERDWQRYDADRIPSSVPTHGCIAKAGPNCNARIMWHCPTGFVDGCNTPGTTGKHECVIRDSDTSCQLRVSMLCPEGFEDGCNNGSSKNHECMPKKTAEPCTVETTEVCPLGFRDACLSDGNSEPAHN